MTSINKPYEKQKDIICNVYIYKLGRYAYLTGSIISEHENPLWGKTYSVYIYALRKTVMVKANNIVREGSLVEINFQSEHFGVLIGQIDYDIMYVYDNEGNSAWIKVTSIQSVLRLDMMPEAQEAREMVYGFLIPMGA